MLIAKAMSEPPKTSSIIFVDQRHYHHQLPPPLGATTTTTTCSSSLLREYRKGNWTVDETLILITAKKLDDERRIKASSTPPDPTTITANIKQPYRTAELRWKWVENYCWQRGCFRSQNQCNDKWDNLLREYKKVREYDSRSDGSNSYWKMDKPERKERNLPSNLAFEVFEALEDVLHRRYPQTTSPAPAVSNPPRTIAAAPLPPPPPPPPPPSASPHTPAPPPAAETSDSSDTDRSEKLDSDTKRRKVRTMGSTIVRSASILAQTLLACEEKKEKRHRVIMELEERRLQIKEARNEVNRKGIAGLVSAVHNLSGAIQALVSDRQDAGHAT